MNYLKKQKMIMIFLLTKLILVYDKNKLKTLHINIIICMHSHLRFIVSEIYELIFSLLILR
jgi:hypothetical protein